MVGGWIGMRVTHGFVGPVASRASRGGHRGGMGRRGCKARDHRRKALGCRRKVQMEVGHVSRFSRLARVPMGRGVEASRRPSASQPSELQIRRGVTGALQLPRFASTGSWQGSRAGCHGRRSGPRRAEHCSHLSRKCGRAARRRLTHTPATLISPFGPNLRPATGSDQSTRHVHTKPYTPPADLLLRGGPKQFPSSSQDPPRGANSPSLLALPAWANACSARGRLANQTPRLPICRTPGLSL